jgi:folate-binding protein YgfZ
MVPVSSSIARDRYDAARQRAAVLDRSAGFIVLSGRDRASYLQGLLTNDIEALGPGQGCYAAYLTPQGRMIADLRVYELGDLILLAVPRSVKDIVLSRLDQFIFTEEVTLGDVSDTFTALGVVGPEAARVVGTLLDVPEPDLGGLPTHGNLRARFAGQPVIVLRVADAGEAGYDLLIDRSHGADLRAALVGAGAVEIDETLAEVLRIEAGVPRFGRDMDEDTIPLEAGIESQAISMTKGCYVGQEVIVRVLHRGHGRVARKLVGLVVESDAVPVPGAAVSADGRQVGLVTSSARSPALDRPIAMAYVHRDYAAAGTPVSVDGVSAIVTAMPFVIAPAR